MHLEVTSDWNLKPVYDVIATLRGAQYPDEWVLRGNHHDGWTFGATDPLSGNIALMAEIKALGQLAKQGWRPKRTLVYASWDGEEPGLLGSTEWAETHADELRRKAVLYINTDANARGFLFAAGSHTFQHVVNEVANQVADPQTGVSVARRARARLQVEGYGPRADEEAKKLAKIAASEADVPIDALGSGSDFTPFLQHVGVASLNLEFGGEGTADGVYHSLYDDYEHHSRFVDPGSRYGAALAQVAGRIVLEVADAEIVPMRFGDFAETVAQYLDEVRALGNDTRTRTDAFAKMLDAGVFRLASDPEHPVLPPPREETVPFLDLSPLENAVARLKRSAQAYDEAYARSDHALPAERRVQLNRILLGMEQKLLSADGLPGREWYQHLVYAPGLYTGYGVKTLPGVREAIEERQWDLANRYAGLTAKVLQNYCDELDKAAALLK